jgi:hypothetical protein
MASVTQCDARLQQTAKYNTTQLFLSPLPPSQNSCSLVPPHIILTFPFTQGVPNFGAVAVSLVFRT